MGNPSGILGNGIIGHAMSLPTRTSRSTLVRQLVAVPLEVVMCPPTNLARSRLKPKSSFQVLEVSCIGVREKDTWCHVNKEYTNHTTTTTNVYVDVSQAYGNNRFDKAIKEAISQGSSSCSSSHPPPPCDAPAYTKGKSYPGGSKVSYK